MPPSITNSTQKERYQYIDTLYHCHNGDCENCGLCIVFKGKEPTIVYKDYILGLVEFNEIKI